MIHAETLNKISGKKVLLVEDEEAVCEILNEALSAEVASLDIAHNGIEAIDMILRSDYDAILLDVSMPRMDGITFFKHLKDIKPHLLPCVIFITGDTETQRVRSFIDASNCAYLDKPFQISELKKTIAIVSNVVG